MGRKSGRRSLRSFHLLPNVLIGSRGGSLRNRRPSIGIESGKSAGLVRGKSTRPVRRHGTCLLHGKGACPARRHRAGLLWGKGTCPMRRNSAGLLRGNSARSVSGNRTGFIGRKTSRVIRGKRSGMSGGRLGLRSSVGSSAATGYGSRFSLLADALNGLRFAQSSGLRFFAVAALFLSHCAYLRCFLCGNRGLRF